MTDPLTIGDLAVIRGRSHHPSQLTAATIRDDYTTLLAEISRLRVALRQQEALTEHVRTETRDQVLTEYAEMLRSRHDEFYDVAGGGVAELVAADKQAAAQ